MTVPKINVLKRRARNAPRIPCELPVIDRPCRKGATFEIDGRLMCERHAQSYVFHLVMRNQKHARARYKRSASHSQPA
jgi:hypothetical protein